MDYPVPNRYIYYKSRIHDQLIYTDYMNCLGILKKLYCRTKACVANTLM